jgi:hypothetical protein
MLAAMLVLSLIAAHDDPVDAVITTAPASPPAPRETWSDGQVFAAQTGITFTGLVATSVVAGIVSVGAGPFGPHIAALIVATATVGVPYLAVSVGDENGKRRGMLALPILAYGVGVLTLLTGASAMSAALADELAPQYVTTTGVVMIGCGVVVATVGVPTAYALTAEEPRE